MKSIKGLSFFCSWSGGKDSCLALYHAIKNGGRPECLLTMLVEEGERSRSHGLPATLLQQQAQSLAIPLVMCSTSWSDYEATFISALHGLKQQGIEVGVFGDIDIEDHRKWCKRVCSVANIQSYHPLWGRSQPDLIDEFIRLDFKATIIAVKQGILDRGFLGRTLDIELIKDIKDVGIDVSGEAGEYHTVVTEGPIFSSSIHLKSKGQALRDTSWILDVSFSLKVKGGVDSKTTSRTSKQKSFSEKSGCMVSCHEQGKKE